MTYRGLKTSTFWFWNKRKPPIFLLLQSIYLWPPPIFCLYPAETSYFLAWPPLLYFEKMDWEACTRAMSSVQNLFFIICRDSLYELSYCTRYKREHLYLTISIISSVYYTVQTFLVQSLDNYLFLTFNTQTTTTQCKILRSGGNPIILHIPNYFSL